MLCAQDWTIRIIINRGSSRNRVGEFGVLRRKKAVHFLAILDFGVALDLASEVDDKNGEATSATLGFVLLPGFSAGTDGMRQFR